ncbi:MAG TPA: DNA/RNA non-specific endonuclease [Acidobacteriota bacterium]|nr:DNA/RNA non-specific endonuclease [Acidobacteriota bacterium]
MRILRRLILFLVVLAALSNVVEAKKLIFPHYGDGGGLRMFFSVTNASQQRATGAIRFFAPDGTPRSLPGIGSAVVSLDLEAKQTVQLSSDGSSDPLVTGYVEIEVNQSAVSALSIFKMAGGLEASVLPVELGRRFSLFVERDGLLDSGVALLRSRADPVTTRLYSLSGEMVSQAVVDFAGSDLQVARNVGELFMGLSEDFAGHLELECGCGIAPLGLRFGASVLSTIAVSDLSGLDQATPEIHARHFLFGVPLGTPESNDLIVRRIYALSSNDATKFPDWVAYRLDPDTLSGQVQDTDRNFRSDPHLDEDETLEPDDYTGANAALGTDRGHLAPLASFETTLDWSETNYLSNIVPMNSSLNRGKWGVLEGDERELVEDSQVVIYVVAGPLFEEPFGTLPGADEPHRVPSGFWKIIATGESPETLQATAFLFAQQNPETLIERIVSVDEVEQRSGLDFFWELDDALETILESVPGDWPLN